MCTSYKDPCIGESGGPLMWKKPTGNEEFQVVGIISFGPKICGTTVPVVYKKVYEYNSWILDTIKF